MSDAKKILIARYPGLLSGIDESGGFNIGDGWIPLLEGLLYGLQWEIDGFPELDRPQFVVSCVKEKFGGLRVYMPVKTQAMQDLILHSEGKSHTICERCGAPGKPGLRGYWTKTYCEPCFAAKK